MKHILHPTDFSRNASQALQFAYTLAKQHGAELTVIHIGDILPFIKGTSRSSVRETEEVRKASLMKLLERYGAENTGDNAAGLTIHYEVNLSGSIAKGLLEVIQEVNPDLVVMGSRGESRLREVIVGSTTKKLIAEAPCPVLAVPGQATAGTIREIVYASDFDPADIAIINILCSFAAAYEATITILHIFPEPHGNESASATFRNRLRRAVSFGRLRYEVIVSKRPELAISRYVQKKGADLLVMYEREHTGLIGLFHKYKVRHMAVHTTVPLLSYNKLTLPAEVKLYSAILQ